MEDEAVLSHVARSHKANMSGALALQVTEREDGKRVAHDGHAVAGEVVGGVARDLREARCI